MGGPMAGRLARLGYRVRVFDLDAARVAAASQAGALAAASPAAAAEEAGVVLLNLPSETAVEEAVFGAQGVADALRPESIVVDFSTVSPAFSRRMAADLAERSGSQWVDAPVSGGPSASGDGTLTVMAGGTPEAIGRIRPLMADLSRQFTHAGPVGAGSTAKLVAQLVVATNYAVLAEAARLAEAAGMDAALLPECVRHGHADGVLMQQLFPRIAAHDFAPRAYARQILKDLEMVQDLARAGAVPTPMSGQATQLFRLLVAAGGGSIDGTGIYRLYKGAPGAGGSTQAKEHALAP